VALDAALSFGESMGFLFDDEIITQRRPGTLRRALGRLREIVASPEPDEDEGSRPAGDDSEILLEDPAEPALSAGAPARKGGAPVPPPGPSATLTKFRGAAPPPEPEPEPARAPAAARGPRAGKAGALLGRVRPVRLRGAPSEGPPPIHPLFRLLSAF
jgi:hypothetical protein